MILNDMVKKSTSFHLVEAQFGSVPNHEYIGKVLLLKSNMGTEIVRWVGDHDSFIESPSSLGCLLHIANNICKELGLCYPPEDDVKYNSVVLEQTGLSLEDIRGHRESVGESIGEIKDIVRESSGSQPTQPK